MDVTKHLHTADIDARRTTKSGEDKTGQSASELHAELWQARREVLASSVRWLAARAEYKWGVHDTLLVVLM